VYWLYCATRYLLQSMYGFDAITSLPFSMDVVIAKVDSPCMFELCAYLGSESRRLESVETPVSRIPARRYSLPAAASYQTPSQ
jgi:hypothetical protein